MIRERIAFIGAGRLATALATRLESAGHKIVAVSSPGAVSAGMLASSLTDCAAVEDPRKAAGIADLVFLAVPDDALTSLDAALDWRPGIAAVHCSGVLGLEALASARRRGARTGCFHPFLSLTRETVGRDLFRGAVVGIEAEGALFDRLAALATSMRSRPISLKGVNRTAYHAAAVFGSNYLVPLVAAAMRLWKDAGLGDEPAPRAVGRLVESVAAAIRKSGPEAALTGPIVRGDCGTVVRHLAHLDAAEPDLGAFYRELGARTVLLARDGGRIDDKRAGELLDRLGRAGAQMRTMLRGKIHRATVTESNLRPKAIPMRLSIRHLLEMKQRGERIPMLTAYDHPSARLADEAGIPVLLVGDSLGMVVLGHDSTIPVTMDDMIRATQAVARGAPRALIVADMPFMSYRINEDETVRNASRLIQEGGAQAVKLEGAQAAVAVRRLVEGGIPVMGHIGLTPQSFHQLGGYRVVGRSRAAAKRLIEEARVLEGAGVFALVLETVPAPLARLITEGCDVPTIGIGAGPHCSGQVQVWHDILGLYFGFTPKHARRYADLASTILRAVGRFAADVRQGAFPTEKESFTMETDILNSLQSQEEEE